MDKKIILFAALALFQLAGAHVCTMVGSIVFPQTIARRPQLTAYYRGMLVEVVDGSYQLPISHGSDNELVLLITLGPFKPVALEDVNTISHFCLDHKAHYKCYHLRKNQNYLGWSPSYTHPRGKKIDQEQPWLISEVKLPTNNRCVMPDSSFVILIDPGAVEEVANQPWQTQGNTCRMPKIVLKKQSAHALRRMADEALLASLDLDPFHRKPLHAKQTSSVRPAFTELMVSTEHHGHFGY